MSLPLRFMQQAMMPIIGVDLSTTPFDHDRSHQFISLKYADGKKLNVIGVRFEDVEKWGSILQKYFPYFPSNMGDLQQQKHEEDLLVERYALLKEYLDQSGYFNQLSLEELKS